MMSEGLVECKWSREVLAWVHVSPVDSREQLSR